MCQYEEGDWGGDWLTVIGGYTCLEGEAPYFEHVFKEEAWTGTEAMIQHIDILTKRLRG